MRTIDIEKQASDIIKGYLDNGFQLVCADHRLGEYHRWDLTNRRDRIEVVIEDKKFGSLYSGVELCVFTMYNFDTKKRDVVREISEVRDYYCIGTDWYGSLEEAKAAMAVREKKRDLAYEVTYRSYKRKKKPLDSDAARKLITPYIREHGYRCKSVKAFDIGNIRRGECGSRKGFYIQVRNDWKFFPFKHW